MCKKYIWYVGYGSNLSKQRFLCYIVGGTPKYGTKCYDRCSDPYPIDDRPIKIPHRLYFALPNGYTKTDNWGEGGVAFINPLTEENEGYWSLCRMWKITCEQYEKVRDKEGRCWYDHKMYLGEEGGTPIYTITNKLHLTNILQPSDTYIKTVALGLKETFYFGDDTIAAYLIEKEGLKKFTKDTMIGVFQSATSSDNMLND